MDRYILLRQYVDKEKKCEKVIAVKTFEKGRSITAESVFTAIAEHVDQSILDKVYSVMTVYVPSFLLIHLKPSAAEGPRITLFQRDLLLAYREIDSEQMLF